MRKLLLAMIGFYQRAISPFTPASCRFHPSCSEYARQAVGRFGAVRGSGLAVRRIFRCHPFGSRGYDPVPALPGGPDEQTRDRRGVVALAAKRAENESRAERTQ